MDSRAPHTGAPRASCDVLVLAGPPGRSAAALAIAGSRAGALGVLDLSLGGAAAEAELRRLADAGPGRYGVLVDDGDVLDAVLAAPPAGLDTVLVAARDADPLLARAHGAGLRVLGVAVSLEEAVALEAAGAEAIVAKGHEAGGWGGEEGSFILLQRLAGAVGVPVWAHGGIGLRTAAAAVLAGAAGVVLDGQLLLARESPLGPAERGRIATMDGGETVVLGAALGAPVRLDGRPAARGVDALRAAEAQLEAQDDPSPGAWRAAVRDAVADGALLLGQDASFAAGLAGRFATTGGIVTAIRDAVAETCGAAQRTRPLAEDAPLARSHGTRYPLVQGPMTRVSDRAEFAAAVAEGGALPFLALALLRGPEVDTLLERTATLAGTRPWGVGILGFVPPELRAEQLAVVKAHRPPFALIAGGRPDQARELEAEGIATYLHVPSPGLLKLYLADGARRFVFEGRECGGHVGPRTSLVLWETMLGILEEELPRADADCHVLLAGGIHDARSAAMAAATAGPAAERGVKVGALLGTAYLFTQEATRHGAITPAFQEAAVAGTTTALVESGPGHATRCLPSPFVEQFAAEKRRLRAEAVAADEVRRQLEELNIGRLRIASKGLDRNPARDQEPDAPRLVELDATAQWERGMYMIGQVAALHDAVTTVADLHEQVASAGAALLDAVELPAPVEPEAPPTADVAIIGLGCILPGAPDVATLWANILDGVDAIGEVPEERWDWRRYYDPDPAVPDKVYSRWGGFIDEVELDPMAFGLPPAALRSIEPFQLLALLTAQSALADAGYATRPFDRERASVILGAGGGGADLSVGYTVRSAVPSLLGDADPAVREAVLAELPTWTEDSFPGLLMNVAAGRIANRLDLGGTNYTVDAACASSLTAISAGVGELQRGTSDLVLAGGIDAIQNPFAFLCFAKTHALSPRGRCRPFDASADGIAISEGFATVVLKRLADAERDGDRIYAVIRGVGAASDGRDRSLTAPRPEGQMRALRRAYAQARFSPATVELVEAHGTGTVAGDAAEAEALGRVYGAGSDERQWCAIGSIKSMIGHTKATAGVAGLVKTALALHHRVLPPTIGVEEPNGKIGLADSPFYVNTEARPWVRGAGDHPRRAGVSAFGFGGTDFHLALEEYTGTALGPRTRPVDRWPAELLLWRGAREGIAAQLDALAARLEGGAEPALADLARTLAEGLVPPGEAGPAERRGTLAIVATSVEELRGQLDTARELLAGDAERLHAPTGIHWSARPLAADGRVAFLFPGQGSQTVDMGRDVALAFDEALDAFERADRALEGLHAQPISRYIFPPPPFGEEEAARRQAELTDTHVAQPALGATELAYLAVLDRLGVRPEMTAGHSYGELVALHAAGALTEEHLLALSEARGRAMAEAAGDARGAMAAVDTRPEDLAELLAAGDVVAANHNAPRQTVLSGPADAVDAALAWCRERGLGARLLPVACAFHSPHVAGAQRRLAERLADIPFSTPRIPVYSNTTGEAHASEPEAIAAQLATHLAEPVQFVREIEAMHRDGARLFVEVGPRPVLTGLVGRILDEREHLAVSVDRSGRPGLTSLLHALAALAAEGVEIDADALFDGRSAGRLDLASLGRAAPPAPPRRGLWKVDGGRAWPADQPRPRPATPTVAQPQPAAAAAAVPDPPDPPRPQEVAMTTIVANGDAPPGAALALPPATAHAGPPLAGADRVGEVMGRYQDVMQHFLETQRSVMLAYLGARRPGPAATGAAGAVPAAPAAAPRVPAPVLTAAPPPIAPPAPVAAAAPAPVVVEPVPAPPAASPALAGDNGHVELTREVITARLLEVVSERTGYPPDMLALDADLEGDLGIDSIKRVEIAGTLTQTLLAGVTVDIEQLTASRTLDEVIASLEAAVAGEPSTTGDERPFEHGPAEEERIGRFVLQSVSAPTPPPAALAAGGTIVVVDDATELAAALVARLERDGETVVRVPAGGAADADAAAGVARDLRAEGRAAKALVHLVAAGPGGRAEGDAGLAALLLLAQALAPDLEAAAAAGGAAVLGACRMDGAFGVADGGPQGAAAQGAIAGFLKSLAQELEGVRVRVVDVGDGLPEAVAERLTAELSAGDALAEVGYRDGARTTVALAPAPLSGRPAREPLTAEDVVLITGGARGITAQVALALAATYRPTLVLAGRTAPPPAEDPQTAGLDLVGLRAHLIERGRRAGDALTPARVEAECRSLLREREVRDTLERLRATGARVDYVPCDVADPAALAALVEDVYVRHGRLDGVVHGAGLIEDRLVRDKTRASLERVMAAKAGAARTLAATVRPESLRFLVFFSSVSGRFGNRGQADYAAASEVLDKLAQDLDRRWACRVVAVEWGPWRAKGMVSPEVERQFAERGVALIDGELGCRLLLDELRQGRKGEAEVVIGAAAGVGHDEPGAGAPALPLLAGASVSATAAGGVELVRTFDVARDRYLDHHRVDGRPVVPFAVAMELMAEAACAARPATPLAGLRAIRLLNGVTVDEDAGTTVRVVAEPQAAGMDVRIGGPAGGRDHYRAIADLGPASPVAAPPPAPGMRPFPMAIGDAYRDLLFHGPLLQGVAAIEGMDERGATAVLRPSSAGRCVTGADGLSWLLDPVLLDCALQVQVLWARLNWDVTLLPAEIGGYRRLAAVPDGPVRLELRVRPDAQAPLCRCDHWFLGADGAVLATLEDVVGVGTRALHRLAGAPS